MTTRLKSPAPNRDWEESLHADGCDVVVGIDEVGKGAWAGPMAVGAVVIPRTGAVPEVRDSKTLSERRREALFDEITAWCQSWSVGYASASECDELGMVAAQRLATRRALESLAVVPTAAVVDGNWDFVSPAVARVETRVKGDASSVSIAAASIVAKVTRDRLMRQLAGDYPMWSFDTNKGYPCPRHRTALQGYGPSAIHRRSWSFMDTVIPWPGVVRQERQGVLF
ncbi:MAG: ribonuclease HII [Ilumatobacteraceae bacterium]